MTFNVETPMTKRSLFWALSFGVLASLGFSTPSMAGLVTTDVDFSVSPTTGTASLIEVAYTPAVDPISNLTLISAGGLSGLSLSEANNAVTATFSPANATTSTLEWTFTTSTTGVGFSFDSVGGIGPGETAMVDIFISEAPTSAVPEPTSIAILGIGMAGLFGFRRFFKRTSAA
jgi:hypothetical protein